MKKKFDICKGCDTAVLIADVHMGVKASSVEWVENITGYFDSFFIPTVNGIIESGHKPCVIVAGDFFDNRDHIDIGVMNHAYDIVSRLSAICPVVLMAGNHDIYKRVGNDITSLVLFRGISNVDVICNPTRLGMSDGEWGFLMVPWAGNAKEEGRIITEKSSECSAIIMHSEISGMSYDNGRSIVDGTSVKGIRKPIYSGHIHKRQEKGKCVYVGSPYHITRSDIGDEKGVYVLDFSDGKLNSRFIRNTYSPKYVRINYSDIKNGDDEKLMGMAKGNYVDVVITKMSDAISLNVSSLMEKMSAYSPKSVTVVTECVQEKTVSIETFESDYACGLDGAFEEYVITDDFSEDDKKRLIEMNDKYLKMAKSEIGV